MEKPTISLCMIVKDEEEQLAKCLSSVLRIVDEIIIVDTGSTDETVSIARAFGAKVISMPWPDSFAAARNRGLEEATCDWILWLDADEVMDVEESEKLKELLTREVIRTEQIEGIQFVFLSYADGGGVERIVLHRMIRNRPEYRFEGRIHEQIVPNMQRYCPSIKLGEVDIHIHHYGTLPEQVLRKNKVERNRALLLQELADDPSLYHHHFYLGEDFFRNDQFTEAAYHLNMYLDHCEYTPVMMQAKTHRLLLQILVKRGRIHEMLQQSIKSIERFPEFTDLYHFPAYAWRYMNIPDKGLEWLQQALRLGPPSGEYPTVQGAGSYITCYDIGQLYEDMNQFRNADLYYTLASLRSERLDMSVQEPPE